MGKPNIQMDIQEREEMNLEIPEPAAVWLVLFGGALTMLRRIRNR